MKFLADHMLGRLAKWLRILGFDTLFLTGVKDQEILKRAAAEDRLILTRDRDLAQHAPTGKSLLIRSDQYAGQIKEVLTGLQLRWKPEKLFSICLECNVAVQDQNKKKVKKHVPRNVFEEHDRFWQCPECRKVFWQGSHYENTREKLIKLGTGPST